MVIPEIGLLLDPIIPTILLETVTKKNPKIIINIPTNILLKIESPGICGKIPNNTTKIKLPIKTVLKERSFSVRIAGPVAALNDYIFSK